MTCVPPVKSTDNRIPTDSLPDSPSFTGAAGGAFARLLHAGCRGFACVLQRDTTTGRTRVLWARAGTLPAFDPRPDTDVWLSVCTFAKRSRKAAAALDVPALWADLDPPEGADLDAWRPARLARLLAFDPPPSLVVDSGRGFHGYWLLAEPIALDRQTRVIDLASAKSLNRALARALDGDAVGDVARVMRLPGFVNPKPGGGLCRLVRADGRRYALADLIMASVHNTETIAALRPEALPSAPDRAPAPLVFRGAATQQPLRDAPDAPRRRRGRPALAVHVHDLRKLPRWARELVIGGAFRFGHRYRKPGGVDRSRADLAAVGAMVGASWSDAMIRGAFERPGWLIGARFRELRDRESSRRADDYLARTIAKARRGDDS